MTDFTDLIARLRQTRADMLGTQDEQHYHDCHAAADALEEQARRIAELEAESKARLTDASTAWDLCETLRARIAELKAALKPVLLDIDFMVEAGTIPDIRSDVIYCAARAALEKK